MRARYCSESGPSGARRRMATAICARVKSKPASNGRNIDEARVIASESPSRYESLRDCKKLSGSLNAGAGCIGFASFLSVLVAELDDATQRLFGRALVPGACTRQRSLAELRQCSR